MPPLPVDLLIAVRVLLALVFLVAGAGKLGHRVELEGVIANYRVLPRMLAGPFARVLGPVEILIGLALSSLERRAVDLPITPLPSEPVLPRLEQTLEAG